MDPDTSARTGTPAFSQASHPPGIGTVGRTINVTSPGAAPALRSTTNRPTEEASHRLTRATINELQSSPITVRPTPPPITPLTRQHPRRGHISRTTALFRRDRKLPHTGTQKPDPKPRLLARAGRPQPTKDPSPAGADGQQPRTGCRNAPRQRTRTPYSDISEREGPPGGSRHSTESGNMTAHQRRGARGTPANAAHRRGVGESSPRPPTEPTGNHARDHASHPCRSPDTASRRPAAGSPLSFDHAKTPEPPSRASRY